MIYRFKQNEMVLTKVQGFVTFKHFSTVLQRSHSTQLLILFFIIHD